MVEYISSLINHSEIKVLLIVIVLDTILGILRAIREKNINSTIGIDGIIRKVAMIFCIFFLSLIDYIVNIDLIGFIPDTVKTAINIDKIGINGLFCIIFIVFEALSILKNAVRCKLPIPKKLQKFFEKIMKEFTSEIKEESEE